MGMLKFIDNVDYGRNARNDAMIEELADIADVDVMQMYEAVHRDALRSIKVSELAITRIMPDLIELTLASPKKALALMRLLANPCVSYEELGKAMGYSKVMVHKVLHELNAEYPWLESLLEIRNANRKNRKRQKQAENA